MTQPVNAAIDFTTPVGIVRGLIPDIEVLTNPNTPSDPPEFMFSDGHLAMLLAVSNNQPLLAAAMACDILGTSEAIISKSITSQDLSTDGADMMKAFIARGKQLRDEGLRQDNQENYDDVPTTFIWQYGYPFSAEAQMLGNPNYDGRYVPIWP